MPKRQLTNGWCDEYVDVLTKYTESPVVWSWWAAVTAVGATLKRQVWVNRGSWKLYPNDYTVLVGDPGLGKGSAINPAHDILKRANTANILSDKLTIEWILEAISKGFPSTNVTATGVKLGFDTSCFFIAPELSIFLRYPDSELPDLADLWDSREGTQMYGTRGRGLFKIESPCPSMLAGCAPKWLVTSIPPNAIGGGFTRRVNFVFAKEKSQEKPWPDKDDFTVITEPLVQDLRAIGQLQGEYRFDNIARPTFEHIYLQSNASGHSDEATANYSISKWAHVTKTAIALAASRRDDLVIKKEDLDEAQEAVENITDDLKVVFRSVGEGDMTSVADKVLQFLERMPGASYRQILNTVWKDVTRDELQVLLMTLRDGGIIDERVLGGNTIYTAVPSGSKRSRVKVAMPKP
jgi:hypothetical protein